MTVAADHAVGPYVGCVVCVMLVECWKGYNVFVEERYAEVLEHLVERVHDGCHISNCCARPCGKIPVSALFGDREDSFGVWYHIENRQVLDPGLDCSPVGIFGRSFVVITMPLRAYYRDVLGCFMYDRQDHARITRTTSAESLI